MIRFFDASEILFYKSTFFLLLSFSTFLSLFTFLPFYFSFQVFVSLGFSLSLSVGNAHSFPQNHGVDVTPGGNAERQKQKDSADALAPLISNHWSCNALFRAEFGIRNLTKSVGILYYLHLEYDPYTILLYSVNDIFCIEEIIIMIHFIFCIGDMFIMLAKEILRR